MPVAWPGGALGRVPNNERMAMNLFGEETQEQPQAAPQESTQTVALFDDEAFAQLPGQLALETEPEPQGWVVCYLDSTEVFSRPATQDQAVADALLIDGTLETAAEFEERS